MKYGLVHLQVSKLGFGCAGLSGIYNAPLSHADGCSIIMEVFNRGITFFDTAEIYGDTDNEIMLGKVKVRTKSQVQLLIGIPILATNERFVKILLPLLSFRL